MTTEVASALGKKICESRTGLHGKVWVTRVRWDAKPGAQSLCQVFVLAGMGIFQGGSNEPCCDTIELRSCGERWELHFHPDIKLPQDVKDRLTEPTFGRSPTLRVAGVGRANLERTLGESQWHFRDHEPVAPCLIASDCA